MNERIKELGIEAGMYVDFDGNLWPRSLSAAECEAAYARFAELILTEVISTIYRSDIGDRKQERLVDELAYKFGLKP